MILNIRFKVIQLKQTRNIAMSGKTLLFFCTYLHPEIKKGSKQMLKPLTVLARLAGLKPRTCGLEVKKPPFTHQTFRWFSPNLPIFTHASAIYGKIMA